MRMCATLFACLMGLFCSSQAVAAANSTEAQALALIQQAQAYIKKHGQDAAFAEFNRLDSPFNSLSDINPNADLYLYTLDYTGYQAVHGKNPKIRGKVMMEMRDSEGVPLIQLMVAKCKSSSGKGWVAYKWPHPISKEVEPKKGYVERIAGTKVCLGTGVYQ